MKILKKIKKTLIGSQTSPVHHGVDLNHTILGLFNHKSKWTCLYKYGLDWISQFDIPNFNFASTIFFNFIFEYINLPNFISWLRCHSKSLYKVNVEDLKLAWIDQLVNCIYSSNQDQRHHFSIIKKNEILI